MNGIAALLEQGRYLAAQTDAFPSTTETVEALNHAQYISARGIFLTLSIA